MQQAYYGTHDNLIVSSAGCAISRNRYDEQGRGIETAYFGPDEKPMAVNGIARGTVAYNERGQVTEMLRFNADGSRLVHPDLGYAEHLAYHPMVQPRGMRRSNCTQIACPKILPPRTRRTYW